MAITNSSGDSLIPSTEPPPSIVNRIPPDVRIRIDQYTKEQRLAVLWTYALAEALQEQPYYRRLTLLPSFGFLDPDEEADEFGVILHDIRNGSGYRTGRGGSLPESLPRIAVGANS